MIKIFSILVQFLLDREIWIAAALAGAGLVWTPLLPYALIGMLMFWPLRRFARGRFSGRTPADGSILVLAVMAVSGAWLARWEDPVRHQVLRLFLGLGLYYAVRNGITTQNGGQHLFLAYSMAGVFLALFSLVGVQWAEDKSAEALAWLYPHLETLVSDASNPNVLAGYLVILLPFPLSVLIYGLNLGKSGKGRPLQWYASIAAAPVIGVILLLTQSRGAWMAAVTAALLLVCLRWKRGWLSILVVAGAAAALAGFVGWDGLLGRILTDRNLASVSDRLDLWHRAVLIIRDFPFTGVGMGAFGEVVELFYPYRFVEGSAAVHAHNLALQVGVELGLPGLIGWISLLFGLGATTCITYRVGRRLDNRWITGSAAAYLASLTAYAVHGLVDAVTWGGVRPSPLVWVIWGGIASLASLSLNETGTAGHVSSPAILSENCQTVTRS